MEQIPINENLKAFRSIVTVLKEQAEKDGKIGLKECNPDELEKEDAEFYNDFLFDNLNIGRMTKNLERVTKSGNKSQTAFHAYIANKVI